MSTQILLTGLIIAAVLLYVFWLKNKKHKSPADADSNISLEDSMPNQQKPNDKMVMITGISYSALQKTLAGFCKMYNEDRYQALPRLIKISEQEFAVIFPYDIEFEIFCYFINYVTYPIDVDKGGIVTAWATTKTGDSWITEENANKKVILFVPADDTEHDNVFMTTSENNCYKLGFGMDRGKQLSGSPVKEFTAASVTIAELNNKEYEDFK